LKEEQEARGGRESPLYVGMGVYDDGNSVIGRGAAGSCTGLWKRGMYATCNFVFV